MAGRAESDVRHRLDGGRWSGRGRNRAPIRRRGKERSSEIVAIDEGRAVVLRSVQGGVSADYTYGVESVDEWSARVSLGAECSTSGAWTLVARLMRYVVRRTDGGQTDALRRWVEAD
jgi:hypothetical protein